MEVKTIKDLALLLSEGGMGDYVIVDLKRTTPDAEIPGDLPHGVSDLVDDGPRALEFEDGFDEGSEAYKEITEACLEHSNVLTGTIVLAVEGEEEEIEI